ncbi:MAG: hypothetical protein QNL04_15430 [SAR324 cluster bacterium]|nr:hypothetical protein [SAR324 cluster bacterium]
MKILVLVFSLFFAPLSFAVAKDAVEVKSNYVGKKTGKAPEVINPKKVLLAPGAVQRIGKKGNNLEIEYEKMHPSGNFPVVRIQGIPFKMTNREEKLSFSWNKAGYDLFWLKKGNQVALLSSADFAEDKLTAKSTAAKHQVIKKGLVVTTKRKNGKTSKLKVTDVQKDKKGRMKKFSTETYAEKAGKDYQSEQNIMAPEVEKQYEKSVNGEILYIFTSNKNGQIYVYYK